MNPSLSGLRYIMHNHPWISSLSGVLANIVVSRPHHNHPHILDSVILSRQTIAGDQQRNHGGAD